MPTVIDELIVVLGLDATKFTQGQKQALESWTKSREAMRKQGKDMEKSFGDVSEAVLGLSKRLLGLGALFFGGLGVEKFTEQIRRLSLEMTNLGRAASIANLSPQTMKALEGMGAAAGVSPQAMGSAVSNIQSQISQYRIFAGGNTAIGQWLSQLGLRGGDFDTPQSTEKALGKINERAYDILKRTGRQSDVNAFLGMGGIGPEASAVFSQDPKKFQEFLSLFKKYSEGMDEQIKEANKVTEAFAKLTASFDELQRRALVPLVPLMVEFLDGIRAITDWYKQNFLSKTPEQKAEDLNKRYGPDAPTGLQRFQNWWNGSGGGAPLGGGSSGKQSSIWDSLNPIGSANASPSMGSEGGGPRVGSQGNISIPGGGGATNLAADRARFRAELDANPALKEKLFGISLGENKNPDANLAVMEETMNRASVRGTSLAREARTTREGGYYEGYDPGSIKRHREMVEANLEKALGGSNMSKYAIDNSSGWLAAKHRRTGAFNETNVIAGEAFQIPGSRESGTGDRAKYKEWRERMESNAFDKGTSAIPFSDWLTNAGTRNMMKLSGAGTTNNRTSSEVNVGAVNVHTQATDAYGIARDLKPLLTNDTYTQPFNGGPN